MKRFVLVLLFWGLLPFGAIGQNVPTDEATQESEKYYTIEQEPKVQLEKEKGKSDLANDYIGEQEKENSFITKVMLFLFSIISFITYLLGYRPLKKIVNDPNLSDYQKYVQLKENNSMWGCGCLFTILFPCLPVGIIYFLMVKRLRRRQLSAIVCDNCGEKNSQQVSTQDDESVTNYFFTCSKCGKVHKESIKKAVRSSSQTSSKSSRKDDSYGSSSSYNRSSSSYNKSYRSGGGASTKF
ncbi:MAG: hypothetical protein HG435_009125 [Capnocytophaga sp.]|nr:hypothetical protein [Capnocytophaga sp.]MBB1569645.1 hypothetical protein [Capnocytophaga sp.]